ncbi:MAG: TolC family protein [Bacteroidota bacterium]
MKTKLLGSVFLLIMVSAAYAQQTDSTTNMPPAGQAWTLSQCIAYAWQNNISVKRSEYNVEESKVVSQQSDFSRLPSVNAQGSYGYSWGRGLDPVSNRFVTQEITSSGVGAQASLPLINGMNIHNTSKQNKYSYQASQLDLAKSKNDVALTVAMYFINVVFSKEQLENAKFQLTSSQQQLERARKQVAAGALPRSEELNLDAQVATNELTVIQRENALNLALLQLKQSLQIPASQPLDVVVPDLDPEDLLLDQSRDQIYETANQLMPEVKSAHLRVESSYYGVKAARGNLLPRLSLNGVLQTNYSSAAETEFVPSGTYSYSANPIAFVNKDPANGVYTYSQDGEFRDTYGFSEQFKDNIYRTLSLQLTIPILNGLQSRTSYQRSVINRERAKLNELEVKNTLRQSVETAYNDALAAAKTYNSSQRQVQAREEAYRMTSQRYENGATNYVDYQVAENELYRAKSDLVRAKFDFIFKKKVLDFYQGKPLEY